MITQDETTDQDDAGFEELSRLDKRRARIELERLLAIYLRSGGTIKICGPTPFEENLERRRESVRKLQEKRASRLLKRETSKE